MADINQPMDEFVATFNGAPGSGIDPNTGAAETPRTRPVDPTAADEPNETFEDAWAKDPTGNAPVRTWIDPTMRETPSGQFQAAWEDELPPPVRLPEPAPEPGSTPPAAPAAPAANPTFSASYSAGNSEGGDGTLTVTDPSTGQPVATYTGAQADDLRQRLANGSAITQSQLTEWAGYKPPATPATPAAPAPLAAAAAAPNVPPANVPYYPQSTPEQA